MEPWGLRWRSKTSFILATVGLGLFTDIFLYSLVLPILPYLLEDRLHVSTEQLQRYSSGLLAAHTGSAVFFCPITGVLVDKFARRKTPYIVGVLVLLLATVLFFLGNSVSILFGARILQGISGALIWTVGQALLIDTVGAEHAGKATGSVRANPTWNHCFIHLLVDRSTVLSLLELYSLRYWEEFSIKPQESLDHLHYVASFCA